MSIGLIIAGYLMIVLVRVNRKHRTAAARRRVLERLSGRPVVIAALMSFRSRP